jgi:ATP-dependent DNA helicase RecQ
MIEIFEKDRCLSRSLSAYFGEELSSPCGRCSICLDKAPPRLPAAVPPPLDALDYHDLTKPLAAVTQSPVPVPLAVRFLCGIATPRLVQSGAKKMPGFGRLGAHPYKAIERWAIENTRQP